MKTPDLVKRLGSRNTLMAIAVALTTFTGCVGNIPKIQESMKPNAIIIISSPKVDYNKVFEDFNEEIEKVRFAGYNVFIDTAFNKEEYFDAFKKGSDFLGEKFDFYLGAAHGCPEAIALGREEKVFKEFYEGHLVDVTSYLTDFLTSDDLQKVDLSSYFNPGARGVQVSCSVADTIIDECFAQSLSNSLGIPIEGPTIESSIPLSEDLHFRTSQIACDFIRKQGFNSEGIGNFDSKNGVNYAMYKDEEGRISVKGLSYKKDYTVIHSFPQDFDTSQVYHFKPINFKRVVREVKPQN